MPDDKKIVYAPCSECLRKTKHEVLFETNQQDEETLDTFVMMSCGGCSAISMGRQRRWIDDGSVDYTYYPSPVSRKMPTWMFFWSLGLGKAKGDAAIGAVMMEVYQAVAGGQYRLAAMGIRALLEQVMIQKVGDLKTFDTKLDEFQRQGYMPWRMPRELLSPVKLVSNASNRECSGFAYPESLSTFTSSC
ncbi:MAG: hypothetical protein QOJ42_2765 [Acidobacteriaceae bacterium]|nr:hypothetical protein [Acidobacteriaceae bacterium]